MLDDPVFRLFLATLLGAVIGFERFIDNKPAGLRTHTLVCVGSAAFVLASERALTAAGGNPDRDRDGRAYGDPRRNQIDAYAATGRRLARLEPGCRTHLDRRNGRGVDRDGSSEGEARLWQETEPTERADGGAEPPWV